MGAALTWPFEVCEASFEIDRGNWMLSSTQQSRRIAQRIGTEKRLESRGNKGTIMRIDNGRCEIEKRDFAATLRLDRAEKCGMLASNETSQQNQTN